MENLDTLMGKYGEEGDKADFLKFWTTASDNHQKPKKFRKVLKDNQKEKQQRHFTERALRQTTIPFARYVAMNYNQPCPLSVTRCSRWGVPTDRKGRVPRVYQCDADV